MLRLRELDPASYRRHWLHGDDRDWNETNCYVDLWIEALHAFGLDPVAAAPFTLSVDFEGDQWAFFKYPPEDLRALYGLDVAEMNVWRPLELHVAEQLGMGRLVVPEVDAWWLPDTTGTSYRAEHVKTSIAVQMIDPESRRLGYFHGSGYHELAGEDYAGLFRLDREVSPGILPPYVETVKLDRVRPPDDDLADRVEALVRDHLGRRPSTNPVTRFERRLSADLPWLASQDLATYHLYAFATCRQMGAAAQLASALVRWLAERTGDGSLDKPAEAWATIASGAKSLQFTLARLVRGRSADTGELFRELAVAWDVALETLAARYG